MSNIIQLFKKLMVRGIYLTATALLAISPSLFMFPMTAGAQSIYPLLISKNQAGDPASHYIDQGGCPLNLQLSSDGRYAMFCGSSPNLGAPRAGESVSEVYVRDVQTDTITLASVNTAGDQENGYLVFAAMSKDGRHVLFSTNATNLDPRANSSAKFSIFERNLDTNTTTLVSEDNSGALISGAQFASVSSDGNIISFNGTTSFGVPGEQFHLYIRNVQAGTTTQVAANQGNWGSRLSANGQSLFFEQVISGNLQVFKEDIATGTQQMVSVTSDGTPGDAPSSILDVSDDGTYLVFKTRAGNIFGTDPQPCFTIVRHNTLTNANEKVILRSDGSDPGQTCDDPNATISGDGNVVAFMADGSVGITDDVAGPREVFVRDYRTGQVRLVTKNRWGHASNGGAIRAVLDNNGSHVLYFTAASNYELYPYSQVYLGSTNDTYTLTDNTVPTVDSTSWSSNYIGIGSHSILTVHGIDTQSGVNDAEFYDQTWGSQAPGSAPKMHYEGNGTFTLDYGIADNTDNHTPTVRTLIYRVMDGAGNWSVDHTTTITVGPQDTTAPAIGTPAWTNNPKPVNSSTTLTVPATDDISGIQQAEYFVGATDPGQGNGTAMALTNVQNSGTSADLTASFGADLLPGAYAINVRAQDKAGNWSDVTTTTLVVPEAPAITSTNTANTTIRAALNFTVTTTGFPAPAITATGTLPAGVTFVDNGDGTASLSGQPAVGSAGTYPFTITADNTFGAAVTQNFTLTVASTTTGPGFVSSSSDTETYGVPFNFTVKTSGYPLPKITKTGILPAGVTFVDNGDGTATIAGTAANAALGNYPLTLKAKSSLGTVTQSFTLTITKLPIFQSTPAKVTGNVGTPLTQLIKTRGFFTPTLTVDTLPSGLSFTDNGDGTGTVTGTPDVGGSFPVVVTATNQDGAVTKTMTFNIKGVPVFTSDNETTVSATNSFSFQVTASGFPLPKFTKSGMLPPGVTFNTATGTLSGTPIFGSTGTYPIVITARNSLGVTTQNFTLIVTDPPS